MSTKTLRKRIALTVVAALATGVLSVAPANAHNTTVASSATNTNANIGTPNQSMFVATRLSSTGAATTVVGNTDVGNAGTSLGLLVKDASSGTAQTATMLTSGVLSLYSPISTAVAYVATGGTFNVSSPAVIGSTATYGQDRRTILFASATSTVGFAWTAPSTAGTYTVSMYYHSTAAPTLSVPVNAL